MKQPNFGPVIRTAPAGAGHTVRRGMTKAESAARREAYRQAYLNGEKPPHYQTGGFAK